MMIFSLRQVLDGLLEEDEEVVETWYLLGWVNRLRATFESKAETGKEVCWTPFILTNSSFLKVPVFNLLRKLNTYYHKNT